MDVEKNWKKAWTNKLSSFRNELSQTAGRDGRGFRWHDLPLEVYEALLEFLDGNSLMNLCHASPSIARLVLEPVSIMSVKKRELFWNKFCIENLDLTFVGKIFCSFTNNDMTQMLGKPDEVECMVSWEDVFGAYQSFWKTLAGSAATVQRFRRLERKLKKQISSTRQIMKAVNGIQYGEKIVTRAGGGDLILNVLLPCNRKSKNKVNGMVVNMRKTDCIKSASICPGGTEFFGVKTAYFPLIRPSNILDIEQVVVSVCNKCITFTSLFGTSTRKLYFAEGEVDEVTDEEEDDIIVSETETRNKCLVFEICKNIVALWNQPDSIKFFVMTTIAREDGYDLRAIYQLHFKGMLSVWSSILKNCSDQLFEVQEFKGDTVMMNESIKTAVLGGSDYLYPPKESTFYGLTLISPIKGVQSVKPKAVQSLDEYNATFESRGPQYYSGNARKYMSSLQKIKCSAKGFGTYVFCSDTTIAASWDRITWVFGGFEFPVPGIEEKSVSLVEVMNHKNGLILVVNEDIYIADLIVKKNGQYFCEEAFLPEPELEVKLLRVVNTGLAPKCREVKHLELNFDQGQPFLLLVSEWTSQKKAQERNRARNHREKCSFVVKRIDFLK